MIRLRKLENLINEAKKAGKQVIIGKVAGALIGLSIGLLIGEEIYEKIYEFSEVEYSKPIILGIKVSPAFLGLYVGQGVGGWAGAGYYFLRRNKK